MLHARDLVARGWCQGAFARDSAGEPVHPWAPEARAWSVLGALIAGDESGPAGARRVTIQEVAGAALALGHAAHTSSLQVWNDRPARTQQRVLATFDSAIELLADEEPASGQAAGTR